MVSHTILKRGLNYYKTTTANTNNNNNLVGKISLSLSLGFEPQRARLSPPRCLTCLLGLQGVQWVRGLVVVRVSWPGHPGLPKKKKMISSCYNHLLC